MMQCDISLNISWMRDLLVVLSPGLLIRTKTMPCHKPCSCMLLARIIVDEPIFVALLVVYMVTVAVKPNALSVAIVREPIHAASDGTSLLINCLERLP